MLPYLLAALPAPRPDETPELGIDAFLSSCRRFLSEERTRELAAAARRAGAGRVGPPRETGRDATGDARDDPHDVDRPAGAPSATARAWTQLADRLDDEVVRARCARARCDPRPYLRGPAGVRLDVAEAVAAAFEHPHPGARERALDRLRWRLADELAATSPIGFAALYARAVQLGIAWRWAGWDVDAGWMVLEAHLRRLEQDASPGPNAASDG